jgi:Leucine-rich repeat (LRR) protein
MTSNARTSDDLPSDTKKEKDVSKISAATYTKIETPLDFSFLNLIVLKDLLSEDPRGRKERKADEKYDVKCIKVNNNHIQDASTLLEVANEIILQPDSITWIDFSFNNLHQIDQVFCQFPALQILYLHGNSIDNIKEVDKLSRVSTLRKLALHGNTMETTKHYRIYVISRCAQLINFDMNTVTKAERETAASIFRPSASTGKRRKAAED